jgi:hypothetical protein
MPRRDLLSVLALALAATTTAPAQEAAPTLTPERRAAVVDSIAGLLDRLYVFPDVASKMNADLRARVARGEFDTVTTQGSFARLLTEHLQAISHDKHLRVRAGAPGGGPQGGGGPPRAPNGAYGRTERLDGDVAYVEIRSFGFPAGMVRESTRAIMSAAADAKALIIDVRTNGGGSPDMVALVSSYLFGEERVHLNSLYFRPADRTDDFYTDPRVAGMKFGPDKPVYVLTSGRTFSAAEEFTYNLQTRKRATIVGATTGGGANPGGVQRLPFGLAVFVPTGRAINPITKTNWEGVGVKPDVAVDADSALATAHRLARADISPRSKMER